VLDFGFKLAGVDGLLAVSSGSGREFRTSDPHSTPPRFDLRLKTYDEKDNMYQQHAF